MFFFVFEFFLLPKRDVWMRLGYDETQAKVVIVWAKNMAVYNLSVALVTFFGLSLIFRKQFFAAGYVVSAMGLLMIAAGITLYLTQPRLKRYALLQAGLPALGFLGLVFHIFPWL